MLAAFRQSLKETGYVEGQNLAIEYRWANDQLDRLPELAADLVRRRVAAIVAGGPAPLVAVALVARFPSSLPVAIYVALAERVGFPLLTADDELVKKMKGHSIVLRLREMEFP